LQALLKVPGDFSAQLPAVDGKVTRLEFLHLQQIFQTGAGKDSLAGNKRLLG